MLDVKVIETHTAVLFFVGDHVYKLKKAVDLGFLDHRDRESRRATCRNEVALNRRLAPDVYLGVIDLVGENGELIDHMVDMARMPEDRRLSRLIEHGADIEPAVRGVAHAIAALHAAGEPDEHHDRLATVDAVRQRWSDGFDQVRSLGVDADVAAAMDRTEGLAMAFLAGRGALFDQRIADGWIRDGHGDLQADDIFVLDDGPRVLDCLEFAEQYRWGDVLSDVAFLAMDLERLGRPDLGRSFLRVHGELCADRWPSTLAHHYIAYRAHIRAKVAVVRSVQRDEPVGASVASYLDLAERHLRSAQVQVVMVGGSPGTGKSTLAAALGDRLGAVVLRSDEVRRRVPPDRHGDRYAPEAVTSTYQELVREARRLVGLGEHVVVDATWGSGEHRQLVRQAAADSACELLELRCTLGRAEADARIAKRRAEGTDPSEATVRVARRLDAAFDPWPEATELSTADAPDLVAERAWKVLDRAHPIRR